ncbi:MAG: protein-(glutamine-N5) methyltransferase, release factor-specific [Candidatus Tectimicrobiota bacterium]|nr:MAG: protein-(glutamine-N5) methyltransferase, release factor-specific [Candidatus Tectomicrobia bacterium]
MQNTVREVLRAAVSTLEAHGVPEARAAAEILLAEVLAIPRSHLYIEAGRVLTPQQQRCYAERLQRRMRREPVQYITGKQEFWSLAFRVTPQVLIPRPESELLVAHGLRFARQWQAARGEEPLWLLDVGTGSGNLAISLAAALPASRVCAIDLSLPALRVAQDNARRLGVAARVTWLCGDLLTSLRPGLRRFALCVANLPYVTEEEWEQLAPEVREYEPAVALVGGKDGLALIRRLIATCGEVLAPGGRLLLEVGWQQAAQVLAALQQQGQFGAMGVYEDFGGIARVVWAEVR